MQHHLCRAFVRDIYAGVKVAQNTPVNTPFQHGVLPPLTDPDTANNTDTEITVRCSTTMAMCPIRITRA
jgi:hypothetical protein